MAYSGNSLPIGPILKGQETKNWTLKTGPTSRPKTWVTNCHYTLCHTPEERRPQLKVFLPLQHVSL